MLLQLFSIFGALGVATTDFSLREYLYDFYQNHNVRISVWVRKRAWKGDVEEDRR
ncbi:hypothetical protein [Gabonibacter chumensis]|uniref:hypothetical protein n=1 Tax=Gabonibacter chumensis TaxID=2972474 RepID=UPI0025738B4D|nr:hypothetical protein [Gabonibacter chumensis]MCR9012023.1 hypothetical protein [Gabonibacter chumensis]